MVSDTHVDVPTISDEHETMARAHVCCIGGATAAAEFNAFLATRWKDNAAQLAAYCASTLQDVTEPEKSASGSKRKRMEVAPVHARTGV